MAKILVLAAFLAVCVTLAAGQSSVNFISEYGFSMAKPSGWYQVEKRVLDDSVSRLELSESGREKLKRDDNETILLVLFTRYLPDSKRGINPKIEVRLIPTGSARPLKFENFQAAYIAGSRSFAEGQINYSFLQEPTTIDVAGGKGVFQITRFTIRTSRRTEYAVRSRTLAIPHKNYYFLIGCVDEIGGDDLSPVFDELVKSIKIGNHN